jgi:hypothetical protein
MIFLSLLAGASAAIMAVAWAVPTFLQDSSIYIRARSVPVVKKDETMDTVLAHQLQERTMTVFDTRKAAAPNIYGDAAVIGTLALLSSDGWGVMYLSDYKTGQEQFWRIIDDRGTVQDIQKVLFDRENGLAYLKLNGSGFPVFSFMEWKNMETDLSVWLWRDGNWKKNTVPLAERRLATSAHAPETSVVHYIFSANQSGVVLNEQGQLIGFIGKDGVLVPNYFISAALPFILTQSSLNNLTVPISGLFVSQYIVNGSAQPVAGFYLAALHANMAKKMLQVGDIILRVNGQPVTPGTLSQLIVSASEDISLDMWRKGAVMTNVSLKKERRAE